MASSCSTSSAGRWAVLLALLGASTGAFAEETVGDEVRGALVYRKACQACHGRSGDGRGPGAAGLDPAPRNFQLAQYEYDTTPSGELPLDEDLARSIRRGVPDTAMPAWRDHLTDREIRDVVAYIKTFSARFGSEPAPEVVPLGTTTPYSAESVARGREMYELGGCAKCHGERGRGASNKDNRRLDAAGEELIARDFTRGLYGSADQEGLRRAILTGMDGTPMPEYRHTYSDAEVADLVNYLLSLERRRGPVHWFLTSSRWYEPGALRVER